MTFAPSADNKTRNWELLHNAIESLPFKDEHGGVMSSADSFDAGRSHFCNCKYHDLCFFTTHVSSQFNFLTAETYHNILTSLRMNHGHQVFPPCLFNFFSVSIFARSLSTKREKSGTPPLTSRETQEQPLLHSSLLVDTVCGRRCKMQRKMPTSSRPTSLFVVLVFLHKQIQ